MRFNASVGESYEFEVEQFNAGRRLDVFLAEELIEPSRSFIKRIIKSELVGVSHGKAKPSYKLKVGDRITVFLPEIVEMSAEPEDIPLDIIFEDEHIAVINKQSGLVVHPGPGHETGTLVNALLHHCGDLSGIGGVLRPGIVHRLDMDTSGCIVIAKSDNAHKELAAQFAERATSKTYLAITQGVPRPESGKVEGQIGRNPNPKKRQTHAMLDSGGRYSLTYYKTLENFGDYALVECDIKTGRTHQIRVHMKHVHAPLVCDGDYNGKLFPLDCKKYPGAEGLIARQALHAYQLSINHPESGERMNFTAPLPDDMKAVIDYFHTL